MSAPERECSRCRAEPAKPGQRWGRACHAAYMRQRRAEERERAAAAAVQNHLQPRMATAR